MEKNRETKKRALHFFAQQLDQDNEGNVYHDFNWICSIVEDTIKMSQDGLIDIIIKNYLDIQVVGKTKESEKAIKDFQQALKRKLLELKEVKPNSSPK